MSRSPEIAGRSPWGIIDSVGCASSDEALAFHSSCFGDILWGERCFPLAVMDARAGNEAADGLGVLFPGGKGLVARGMGRDESRR